jgi:hypothetical protein
MRQAAAVQVLPPHDLMVHPVFKTRSLRFEWEATNPPRPLIAKNAMTRGTVR